MVDIGLEGGVLELQLLDFQVFVGDFLREVFDDVTGHQEVLVRHLVLLEKPRERASVLKFRVQVLVGEIQLQTLVRQDLVLVFQRFGLHGQFFVFVQNEVDFVLGVELSVLGDLLLVVLHHLLETGYALRHFLLLFLQVFELAFLFEESQLEEVIVREVRLWNRLDGPESYEFGLVQVVRLLQKRIFVSIFEELLVQEEVFLLHQKPVLALHILQLLLQTLSSLALLLQFLQHLVMTGLPVVLLFLQVPVSLLGVLRLSLDQIHRQQEVCVFGRKLKQVFALEFLPQLLQLRGEVLIELPDFGMFV